jgi:hypothetical protein
MGIPEGLTTVLGPGRVCFLEYNPEAIRFCLLFAITTANVPDTIWKYSFCNSPAEFVPLKASVEFLLIEDMALLVRNPNGASSGHEL